MPQSHRSKYRSKAGQLAEKYGIRRDQVPRFLELAQDIYQHLVRTGVSHASKAHARELAARIVKAE
jgi:hypothetical protein